MLDEDKNNLIFIVEWTSSYLTFPVFLYKQIDNLKQIVPAVYIQFVSHHHKIRSYNHHLGQNQQFALSITNHMPTEKRQSNVPPINITSNLPIYQT